MQTEYLDWKEPAIPGAVDRLIDHYSSNGECDLSGVIVVFPGRQAGRRFLEVLTEKSNGRAIPPKIITVGALPEFLYVPKKPFATPLTQQLCWVEALKAQPQKELEKVIPQPPADVDVDAWLSLGELISRQHRELAADRMNFSSVASKGRTLDGFNEVGRWEALAKIQQSYLNHLDDLLLWDQQTARLEAITRHECHTDNDIILIGAVDLNQTTKAMLDQVRDKVTVYIHASESIAGRFDEFGSLIPEQWQDAVVEIPEHSIHVVDGPREQAAQVAVELAAVQNDYQLDEVTIAVPDDRIVPHIRRTMGMLDVPTNWVIAQTLPETAPYRLLVAIADYLEGNRTDHFSLLIRHPDLTDWIDRQQIHPDWLTLWDKNFADHLQRRTTKIFGTKTDAAVSRKLIEHVHRLLKPLRKTTRPLSDWAEPLRDVLLEIYGDRELDRNEDSDRLLLQACEKIHTACLDHGKIPEALAPVVTAQQAIKLTLDQLRGEFLPAANDEYGLQLSGWLDMPLDDAPLAIVTSLNEGYIPSAVNHDLFLPNRLRAHLGIEDNGRRYARDAYAMSTVIRSRKRICLISAKRDVQQEPLTPSRLLFASDPMTIAKRVTTFFDESGESTPRLPLIGITTDRSESDFVIPRPQPHLEVKRSFRVTEFKDYLLSPYRYYLRHILHLKDITDDVVELDPAGFGSLIHEVLDVFGKGPEKNQTDPVAISRFMSRELDQLVKKRYGDDPLFPVLVQVEQVRHRLDIFSEWQARWRREGWEIRFSEVGIGRSVDFPLGDGTNIQIRGRIDRIDYHPRRDEWVIFDYKTSDRGDPPEKTHQKKSEWIDLQLPLYRYLAKPYGVKGDVRLGYITLPRTTTEIRDRIAKWSAEDLENADDKVRETALRIINQEFWEPLEKPYPWTGEFSRICQDDVFDREAMV